MERYAQTKEYLIRLATRILALALLALLLVLTFGRASAAVTITSFTAKAKTASILLEWKTASEVSNAGFNLYRSTSSSGPWTNKINSNLIPGCPGCLLGGSYSFDDTSAPNGQTSYYKLESVEFSGGTQQFGPVSATAGAQAASPTPTRTSTRTPTTVPTATRTPTATSVAAPTNTPVVPTATAPAATTTRAPNATATTPPTRVAFFVQPTVPSARTGAPNVAPNDPAVATPEPLQEAVVVVLPPEDEDVAPATESATETDDQADARDSSYYLRRLAVASTTLLSGLLGLGAFALGITALYLFLRAHLR
jgi:hypothetical protein